MDVRGGDKGTGRGNGQVPLSKGVGEGRAQPAELESTGKDPPR